MLDRCYSRAQSNGKIPRGDEAFRETRGAIRIDITPQRRFSIYERVGLLSHWICVWRQPRVTSAGARLNKWKLSIAEDVFLPHCRAEVSRFPIQPEPRTTPPLLFHPCVLKNYTLERSFFFFYECYEWIINRRVNKDTYVSHVLSNSLLRNNFGNETTILHVTNQFWLLKLSLNILASLFI